MKKLSENELKWIRVFISNTTLHQNEISKRAGISINIGILAAEKVIHGLCKSFPKAFEVEKVSELRLKNRAQRVQIENMTRTIKTDRNIINADFLREENQRLEAENKRLNRAILEQNNRMLINISEATEKMEREIRELRAQIPGMEATAPVINPADIYDPEGSEAETVGSYYKSLNER